MSFTASSNPRAVSTANPCWEKYSLMEKRIDSSSSTTNRWSMAGAFGTTFFRPNRKRVNRPETVLKLLKWSLVNDEPSDSTDPLKEDWSKPQVGSWSFRGGQTAGV